INSQYQKDVWTVEVDMCQMEQVLLNLYINAWQAMPNGGEIHLKTKNVVLNKDNIKSISVTPGKYVNFSVSDTGVGMDEKTVQRIFEPFFTTKEIGRGTGLGLASAYGIIKNHGGFITVTSKISVGSTFDIFLPASDKKLPIENRIEEEIIKGDKTVLIIDDEKMVLDVMPKMLNKLGYKTLTAQNGKDAIDIYENNIKKIDIVILDIIMPEISGAEVFKHLKEIDPNVKVLLCSGYSIEDVAPQLLQEGCKGFIKKPFNMIQLSHKLKEI
ncbi:MAG: response regulator, partial [Desulfobacterales bacterium]|nr:response regulator [Desulfobacterales bacterium]